MTRLLKEAKRSWIYVAMFALMLTFAWAPAEAFGPNQEKMTAEIPFDFMLQGKEMDAGTYMVWAEAKDNGRVMFMENADGESVAFLTMSVPNTWSWAEERKAHLSFQELGDHVFLDGVRVPAHSTARRVPDSDMQDELEDEGMEPKQKTVTLKAHKSSD